MLETTYMGILCGVLAGLVIIGFIGCAKRRREDAEEKKDDKL